MQNAMNEFDDLKAALAAPGALEQHIIDQRNAYHRSRSSARTAFYKELADRMTLAMATEQDAGLLRQFKEMQLLTDLERDPASVVDVLTSLLRIFEGKDKAAEKRVSKQVIALRGLRREGVLPSEMSEEFTRRGGFAAVVRQFAKPKDASKNGDKPVMFHLEATAFAGGTPLLCIVQKSDDGSSRTTVQIIGPAPVNVSPDDLARRLIAQPEASIPQLPASSTPTATPQANRHTSNRQGH